MADRAGYYTRLCWACALRRVGFDGPANALISRGIRPWRGPVLAVGHSQSELPGPKAGCDVAEAPTLRGHVAERCLTFVAPNP